ncbi:unannotated protein [freshwater metagenome]|uniref:Unannotated protein n=1 Tax=freshwater metagenome TaxID=449393 RepID=A0A6J7U453_9ZZZZ
MRSWFVASFSEINNIASRLLFVSFSISSPALAIAASISGLAIKTLVCSNFGSSRSSGDVNAACSGPRRALITTSRIADSLSAAIAWSAVSVGSSSLGSRANMRATSIATFPAPITTAVVQFKSILKSAKSGCALYQGTKCAAEIDPGKSSPGIPSFLPTAEPVAITTASYISLSCSIDTSVPSSTLPNKRKFPAVAIFSKTFATVLIFG